MPAEGGRELRVGVVGTGAMGRNHARILSSMPGVWLVGIYDPRREAAEAVARDHGTRVFPTLAALAGEVEAAVLAAPTGVHAEVGCELLGRGLHLLVEKPLAASLAEADRLIVAAAGDGGTGGAGAEGAGAAGAGAAEKAASGPSGKVLGVGHVEYFNPAVQALLGVGVPPRYVEVQRLAVFSPRSLDVDVVLDLMIHDLQILHALDPSPVAEVRATGIPVLSPRTDIANARVELASGCVANLTASRVSAERVRKLRTFLPSCYYSLDYQAQEIHGFRLEAAGMGRRIVPDDLPVERAEPLRRELEGFVAACREAGRGAESGEGGDGAKSGGRKGLLVDGAAGRRALATAQAVAEAIRRTMR